MVWTGRSLEQSLVSVAISTRYRLRKSAVGLRLTTKIDRDNFMQNRIQAVIALSACCLAIFLPGAFVFGFPGVMGHHWQNMFDVSRAEVGSILFYVLAAVGTFMFVTGRLQERIGPRLVTAISAILCSLGVFMVGYANSIRWVYIWAFITGAASAFAYLPSLTVAQRWYPQRRGLATGLVSMSFGISGAAMAPVFNQLFQIMGYVALTRVMGITVLIVGIAAAALIRLPATTADSEDSPQKPAINGTLSLSLLQSLKTRSFWLLWLTYAFAGAAGISMVTLSVNFGLVQGLTMGSAVFILTAFNITNGLSRLVSGYASDLIGRKQVMCISFVAAGAAYLLFTRIEGLAFWCLFAAAIGFAFGALNAVSAPLVSDCFGMDHFASVFGMVFTAFGFVSGILGPWLGGFLLDVTQGNFMLVYAYMAALMFISALMLWFISPRAECTF